MFVYVVAALVLAFVVSFTVATVNGRLRVRSCCAVADPSKDLRMRAAFPEERD